MEYRIYAILNMYTYFRDRDYLLSYVMADLHIFPILEPEMHIESEKCECSPVKEENGNTGDITWIHKPLRLDNLIDELELH